MKRFLRVILMALVTAAIALPMLIFVACDTHVDYVSQLHLDLNSSTKKQEVSVRLFIDGDTTHFNPVQDSDLTGYTADDFKDTLGYIKARYLAIDTPESTGQVQEWGKAASKFTKSKLQDAESIIVESDKDYWDIDSTGERYLLWVWYKPEGDTEFRNLNVEILQEGYAFASRTSNGIYGEIAQKALDQAIKEKLHVYSDEKDPDFYYGNIKEVSLKELRCFPEEYDGVKVSVEGTVVTTYDSYVFIESYDEDEDLHFGMQIFLGSSKPYGLADILKVGNKVKIVGTHAYADAVSMYQISGVVAINAFDPDDPSNCKVLATGVDPDFPLLDLQKQSLTGLISIDTGRVDEEGEPILVEMAYAEATQYSSVELKDLHVDRVSTTNNGGDSDGAMTLYCTAPGGISVQVRTEVFEGKTADDYKGKTIDVKGFIEKFTYQVTEPVYQIKAYRESYVTVH